MVGTHSPTPSLFVGLKFWSATKAMPESDRRERAALARLERQPEGSEQGPASSGMAEAGRGR